MLIYIHVNISKNQFDPPQLEGERQDHGRALSVSNVRGHESEHCWDHHSGCYGIHTSCPFLDELFLPA